MGAVAAMNEREVLTVVGALTRDGWKFTSEGEGSAGTVVTAKRGALEYRATDLTAEGAYLAVVKAIREAENPPPVRAFLNAGNHYRPEVELRRSPLTMTPEEAEGLADSLRVAAADARAQAIRALPRAAKALEKAHRDLRAIGSADSTVSACQTADNARHELETLCAGGGMPLPGTMPNRRQHI